MSASNAPTDPSLDIPLQSPDFHSFKEQFESAVQAAGPENMEALRALGTTAFEAFLRAADIPDQRLLRWFVDQCNDGNIAATERILFALRKIEEAARRAAERRKHANLTPVLQTRRVVQLSWFGMAGFQSSDAFEVRLSIYRSPQEREFCMAARLRFPGLTVLPNYPLRCFVDLDKLAALLPDEMIRYARSCEVDFLLVTPREGDAVAVIELDSKLHDDTATQRKDEWRNTLLSAAQIPLYRLRSESPTATSLDEWYAILTDEVVDKIDCGTRIRNRELHRTLVPIPR